MTTIVVVKRDGQIAISGDSLVTFGDTRLASGYEKNEKIFHIAESFVGISGTVAHFPVLRKALKELPLADLRFGSREEVFATFQKLHPVLKEAYFLNTKEEDTDPYESSQLTCLIANATGIYGVYSYREVFEFERFWGIGSGRSFALGAMFTAWDNKALSAKAIAELGVRAGAEFDKNSAAPFHTYTLEQAEVAKKPRKKAAKTASK